ncbi:MAG: hypothetical protein LBB08_00770 [Rickettsiales bacterium]|jgi:hypothetical protein|nr:hypothetical protein [Rickettsiales bacterium]
MKKLSIIFAAAALSLNARGEIYDCTHSCGLNGRLLGCLDDDRGFVIEKVDDETYRLRNGKLPESQGMLYRRKGAGGATTYYMGEEDRVMYISGDTATIYTDFATTCHLRKPQS